MRFLNSCDRWEFSMMIQDMTDAQLDKLGKRKNLEFTRIGTQKTVVYRESVLTGHAGYRVNRGPEQRPWWWKQEAKPSGRRGCYGSRDPVLMIGDTYA